MRPLESPGWAAGEAWEGPHHHRLCLDCWTSLHPGPPRHPTCSLSWTPVCIGSSHPPPAPLQSGKCFLLPQNPIPLPRRGYSPSSNGAVQPHLLLTLAPAVPNTLICGHLWHPQTGAQSPSAWSNSCPSPTSGVLPIVLQGQLRCSGLPGTC